MTDIRRKAVMHGSVCESLLRVTTRYSDPFAFGGQPL